MFKVNSLEVLLSKCMKKMDGCFTNNYIAYKILLDILFRVANAKELFIVEIDQDLHPINYVK